MSKDNLRVAQFNGGGSKRVNVSGREDDEPSLIEALEAIAEAQPNLVD
jgi:hypothetical protein